MSSQLASTAEQIVAGVASHLSDAEHAFADARSALHRAQREQGPLVGELEPAIARAAAATADAFAALQIALDLRAPKDPA